jgi:CO/xanthine dehydrogenase FAD-binding subunit
MVEHIIPKTLKDTLEYIDTNPTTIIAGGTDLMVQRRNWASLPPHFDNDVVYIFNLQELKYIKDDAQNVYIGATLPLSDIRQSYQVPELLHQAIDIIASPALRNVATIPGNIGNASPAGDTLPVLYVYDALIRVSSVQKETIVPIEQLILGPRKTMLDNNELITEVILPKEEFTHVSFKKVGGRKADAISKVSFAGAATIQNKTIKDIRLAFGAVAPTVVRIKEIEQSITGQNVDYLKDHIEDIKAKYAPHITPIDDQRSNRNYRHHVALNILEEFLRSLL